MSDEATGDTATPEAQPTPPADTQEQKAPEAAPAAAEPVKPEVVPEAQPEGSIADAAKAADAEGDSIKDAAGKAEEAPEQADIEYDIKAPEGVKFEESLLDSFKVTAKDLGLTNENAQKLVDFQAEQVQAQDKLIAEQLTTQTNEWKQTAQSDKNYKQNIQLANAGTNVVGEEGYTMLKEMQIEWNPVVFNMLVQLGKTVSEGKLSVGGAPAGNTEKTMYPEMAKYKAQMGIE